MGVKDLSKILIKYNKTSIKYYTNLNQFNNKTFIIDSNLLTNKFHYGVISKKWKNNDNEEEEEEEIHQTRRRREEVDNLEESRKKVIKYWYSFLNNLHQFNIKPILVFDGLTRLPEKANENLRRLEQRIIVKQRSELEQARIERLIALRDVWSSSNIEGEQEDTGSIGVEGRKEIASLFRSTIEFEAQEKERSLVLRIEEEEVVVEGINLDSSITETMRETTISTSTSTSIDNTAVPISTPDSISTLDVETSPISLPSSPLPLPFSESSASTSPVSVVTLLEPPQIDHLTTSQSEVLTQLLAIHDDYLLTSEAATPLPSSSSSPPPPPPPPLPPFTSAITSPDTETASTGDRITKVEAKMEVEKEKEKEKETETNQINVRYSPRQTEITLAESKFFSSIGLSSSSSCSLSTIPEERIRMIREEDVELLIDENWTNEIDRLLNQSQSLRTSYVHRSKGVPSQTHKDVYNLATHLGIPCLQPSPSSPHEAEGLCSTLVLSGYGDYVVSEDSDVLIYGAKLLRRVNTRTSSNPSFLSKEEEEGQREMENEGEEERGKAVGKGMNVVDPLRMREDLGLTKEELIEFALLCGTDFTERIPKCGPTNALKLIKEHHTIEALLSHQSKFQPPDLESYLQSIQAARKIYNNLPPLPCNSKEELEELLRQKGTQVGLREFLKGWEIERIWRDGEEEEEEEEDQDWNEEEEVVGWDEVEEEIDSSISNQGGEIDEEMEKYMRSL